MIESTKFNKFLSILQIFLLIGFIYAGIIVLTNSISTKEQITVNELDHYPLTIEGGRSVFIADDVAFTVDEYYGLMILNISDPINIRYISNITGLNRPRDVVVKNNICYIVGTGEMQIYNVTNLNNPEKMSVYTFQSTAHSVSLEGNIIVIGAPQGIIHIVNVTDPTTPTLLSKLISEDISHGVILENNILYWADNLKGLKIYNLSNPQSPQLLSRFANYGEDPVVSAYNLEKVGNKIYLIDIIYGLIIIDVSNLTEPIEVGRFFQGGPGRAVQIIDKYAFNADYRDGLEIINLETNKLILTYDERPNPQDIVAKNNRIYLISQSGFSIIEIIFSDQIKYDIDWVAIIGYLSFTGFFIIWKLLAKKAEKIKDY